MLGATAEVLELLPMLPSPQDHRRARRGGFSLVEVVLVLAILSVASAMYAQTVASSHRLDPVTRDTNIAAEAVRVAIERLRAAPVDQLIATFDANPANDPDGPGTAPGATFAVEGLAPRADGTPVGSYLFPMDGNRLAENVVDDMLGSPRDLNGDHVVDALDHQGDWVLLPVRVRVEWLPRGSQGATRHLEIYTLVPRL